MLRRDFIKYLTAGTAGEFMLPAAGASAAVALNVVIIGGGIVGASIAYHLGKRKMGSVILLEKERLGEGSTGRCLGGIRCQFSTSINIRFSLESFRAFQSFREELGVDPEFRQIGYLFLASTSGGEKILKEQLPLWLHFGIPVELLEAEELLK